MKRELEDKTGISLQLLLGRQASVSDFMRKMLVRRFESSVAAFKESLNSMIQSSESILRWIEKRDKIPVYKKGSLPDVDEFYETTDDDLSQEIEEAFEKYTDRGFFEIDMKYIKRDEYLGDMLSDLNLLRQIQEEWFGKDQVIRFDHKLTEFKAQLRFLRASDPKRKTEPVIPSVRLLFSLNSRTLQTTWENPSKEKVLESSSTLLAIVQLPARKLSERTSMPVSNRTSRKMITRF